MAATPICSKKTLKNNYQNRWAYCLITCYVTHGNPVKQSLYKWWPSLTYFTAKLFLNGKNRKVHFSVAIVLCDMNVQSASIPLNLRGQGHLMIFAKVHMSEIFESTSTQKLLNLIALLALFGTVTFCLQKISNFLAKTICPKIHITLKSHGSGNRSGPNGSLVFVLFRAFACRLQEGPLKKKMEVVFKCYIQFIESLQFSL